MLVALLTGAANGRQNVSLLSKTAVLSFLARLFFSKDDINHLPVCIFFFLQGQPRLTVDKRSQDGHIICPVIFLGGEYDKMNAMYHVFFFFSLPLSFPQCYAQISYRLTKRTGKQVKQRFRSCLKVVRALARARDQFKSLRSGLILFLHLGTV